MRDDQSRPLGETVLRPDRRHVVLAGGATLLGACASPWPLAAAPAPPTSQFNEALRQLLRRRVAKPSRVALDIPRLAESGNSVAVKVSVASQMTEADHVQRVHILSEQNPVATIAVFTLGPRAGRAEVATNIRLATTQHVHALAEMSDGSIWTAHQEVVVLLAACLDES